MKNGDVGFNFGQQGLLQPQAMKLTYSIKPARSLIVSSELIVDYIADKIEQSQPVSVIFNELLRFFETEALCLGPSFRRIEEPTDNSETATQTLRVRERSSQSPKGTKGSSGSDRGTFEAAMGDDSTAIESFDQRPKVLGFRIVCSGRLQMSAFSKPAEIAESIELTRGVLPLNTFSANIDFAQTHSTNAYGTCGIKV
jgi:hypothetical protein